MNTEQKSVTLTFKKTKANQPVVLPQAELIRGVAGSVFAVQIADAVFAVDMASVVAQLVAENTSNVVQAPFQPINVEAAANEG